MSSTYRILCLSHDPAIVLDEPKFQSGDDGRARAEAAVVAGIDGHLDCDLLIGRYSYPLVEVGCPPSRGHQRLDRPRETEWVGIEWLRLLGLAYRGPEGSAERQVAERLPRWWSSTRLHRLRNELDLPEGTPQ